MISIIGAGPADMDRVRGLWSRYWDELGFTPCFQDFSAELTRLPGRYARPDGCLLLAVDGDAAVGAVAYRRVDRQTCEAKRLYVEPEYRAAGAGRLLMERLLAEARAAGYARLVGDTMPVMARALALYDAMGFRRTEPYAGATEGSICIEYRLTELS